MQSLYKYHVRVIQWYVYSIRVDVVEGLSQCADILSILNVTVVEYSIVIERKVDLPIQIGK